MTKIVYIYSDKVEVEPFSRFFDTCKIDLADCQEKNLSTIYSRLGNELTNAAALIIDRKCGLTESEIFDLATYTRLSHDQSWDIPMMVYDNESGTKDFYALYKADQTGIAKTQRFELLSEKMAFEEDILTGEIGLQRLIKSMMQQNLDWQTFISAIEVKNSAKDNHTIANEWAIHRWSQTIGVEDEAILKNYNEINSSLYFKYLQAVYPILDSEKIDKQHLRIEGIENKKILYIDDEAEKGWYEIFAHIFYDINGADFSYLCEELAGKSQAEIIETSLAKIIGSDANKEEGKADADIVILDFRLHEKDSQSDINEITGLKILKKIKEHNPGIQVIVFSATNKVWNLEAIQKAGADGFIIKESPAINVYNNFTKECIESLTEKIKERAQLLFLKEWYEKYRSISEILIPRKKNKHHNPLPKEFVNESLRWFKLSNDIISEGKLSSAKVTSSFLFKFSVLENIANRIIDVDNPKKSEQCQNSDKPYYFEFRTNSEKLRDFVKNEKGLYERTSSPLFSTRNIPWAKKILNAMDFISKKEIPVEQLNIVIKKRNDFIHPNSTMGTTTDINYNDLIFLHNLITDGLENVQ